jgi:hypothetical protein
MSGSSGIFFHTNQIRSPRAGKNAFSMILLQVWTENEMASIGPYNSMHSPPHAQRKILASLQVIGTSKILLQFKQILRKHPLPGWAYICANREFIHVRPGHQA